MAQQQRGRLSAAPQHSVDGRDGFSLARRDALVVQHAEGGPKRRRVSVAAAGASEG